MAHRRTTRQRRARRSKSDSASHTSHRGAASTDNINGPDTAQDPNTASPTGLPEAMPDRTISTSRGPRRATNRTTSGNVRDVRPMRKGHSEETMAGESEIYRGPSSRRTSVCNNVRPSDGHCKTNPRPRCRTKTTGQSQARRAGRPNLSSSGLSQTRAKTVRALCLLL